MIRTDIVDYDDDTMKVIDTIEIDDQRYFEILSICDEYLGGIINNCHLSADARTYIFKAFDYIDEAMNVILEEKKEDQ